MQIAVPSPVGLVPVRFFALVAFAKSGPVGRREEQRWNEDGSEGNQWRWSADMSGGAGELGVWRRRRMVATVIDAS